MQKESKNRPVYEVRLGRVRAAIWEFQNQHGLRHSVTFSKRYKDGNVWKDGNSFYPEELPILAKTLDLAHNWIHQNSSAPQGDDFRES